MSDNFLRRRSSRPFNPTNILKRHFHIMAQQTPTPTYAVETKVSHTTAYPSSQHPLRLFPLVCCVSSVKFRRDSPGQHHGQLLPWRLPGVVSVDLGSCFPVGRKLPPLRCSVGSRDTYLSGKRLVAGLVPSQGLPWLADGEMHRVTSPSCGTLCLSQALSPSALGSFQRPSGPSSRPDSF